MNNNNINETTDSIEEEQFYDKVKKTFGIDKNCIVGIDKIYNLTVATNMLITLFATMVIAYGLNYFNIFYHNYIISELFLTCIVIFTIWNFMVGYPLGIETYSISTNTSLLLAIFILPLLYVGPNTFISYFC